MRFHLAAVSLMGSLSPVIVSILIVMTMILVIISAIALVYVFFKLSWVLLQKKQQAIYPLALSNQSNLQTAFQFRFECGDQRKKVKPTLFLGKKQMKVKTIEQVTYVEEEVVQPKQAKPKAEKKKGEKGKAKSLEVETKKKVRKVSAFAGIFASISSALATILPGSMKTPFQAFAKNIRSGQQTANDVMAKPEQLADSSERIKDGVERIGNTTSSEKSKKSGAAPEAEAAPKKTRRAIVNKQRVIETKPLFPGEVLSMRLRLRPSNPFKKMIYSYTMFSQQLTLKEFPPQGDLCPQTLRGEYQVNKMPIWATILFILFNCMIIFLIVFSALILLQWLVSLI